MKRFSAISFLVMCLLFGRVALSAAEVMVFSRSWMERGNARDVPRDGELAVRTIPFTGCSGEYSTAQLLLRCDEPVVVKAAVNAPLTDEAGNNFPLESFTISEVLHQTRWHNPRQYERLPYVLIPTDTFRIKPKQTSRLWLSLRVPAHTPAGCYKGTLELSCENAVIKTYELTVTVRPFELLPVPSSVYCLSPCWGSALFPEWIDTPEYLTKLFKFLKANKFNGFECSYKTPEDFWPYLEAAGMLEGGTYIWTGAWNHLDKMRAVYEKTQKAGCRLILFGQDEPNDEAKRETQRYLTKLFRENLPECKIITALQTGTVDTIGDALDIWEPEAIDLDDALVEKAARQQKELWAYECRLAPVDALNSRFFHGLLAWRTALKGTVFWYLGGLDCGYGFIKDRYDVRVSDYTSYNGDWQYNFDYVIFQPDGLYYTIGLIAMRDGMQDMEYLYTLRQTIELARKKDLNQAADDAEKLLTELRQAIHPEVYGKTFWKAYKSDNRRRNAELGINFFRPAPEFTPEMFGIWREKIADAIETLQKKIIDLQRASSAK